MLFHSTFKILNKSFAASARKKWRRPPSRSQTAHDFFACTSWRLETGESLYKIKNKESIKMEPKKTKDQTRMKRRRKRTSKKEAIQPQVSQKKTISFGDVELREYAIELGDNPSTCGKFG
jgi:hypothetical protein